MTVSGIMLNPVEENGSLKLIIQAVFFRNTSWLKTDSAYGLNHEQMHFDICEIYARRLRQKIASKNLMRNKKLNAELNNLYRQINQDLEKEQDRYDRETEHSIKTERQELWNKKILAELEELKEYSGTEIKIGE
jgi:hypothetical protein